MNPRVIIIDHELTLINTISSVYPMSKHLLCEQHIAKAVLTQVKKNHFFDDDKLEDKFMSHFAGVVSLPTEDLYKSKLAKFKKDYQQQQIVLFYIDKIQLEL